MKIAAIIIVVLFTTLFGVYKAAELKLRKDELMELTRLAETFRMAIGFSKYDIGEIISGLSEKNASPLLAALSHCDLSDGLESTYSKAKKTALLSSCLTKNDWSVTDGFFTGFGKSGLDDQLTRCDCFCAEISACKKDAESRFVKYARLYVTAGFTIGVLIAVMLM